MTHETKIIQQCVHIPIWKARGIKKLLNKPYTVFPFLDHKGRLTAIQIEGKTTTPKIVKRRFYSIPDLRKETFNEDGGDRDAVGI